MGFFTDFDDSTNMVWDETYDGSVMPQTVGWTENITWGGSGSIVTGELIISGQQLNDIGSLGTNTSPQTLISFDGNIYGGGSNVDAKIYRYDGGTTWTSIGELGIGNTAAYTLTVHDSNLYASAGGHVYRYDGGTTWTDIGQPGGMSYIKALISFYGNLYVGGEGGDVYKYQSGTTWITRGTLGSSIQVSCFVNHNNTLYAGTAEDGKIFRYDGDYVWTDIGSIGAGTNIPSLASYDGNLYSGSSGTGADGRVWKYDGGTLWISVEDIGQMVMTFAVFNGYLYAGESDVWRYDGLTWTELRDVGGDVKCFAEHNDDLYVGVSNAPAVGKIYNNIVAGSCYYTKTVSGLDPRTGWTIEANIEKTIGDDENFKIIINDGTYGTMISITNQGYIKLMQYDKNDLIKSKKADFQAGTRHILKIARKDSIVKLYVDGDIVLISQANAPAGDKVIYFGQYDDTSDTYQAVIDWFRYNDSIPCFETLYLPKYYFQDKESIIDSDLEFTADNYYIKLYNYTDGWDRIFNHVKAEYGDYAYYANPYNELDESPNSEDTYGKRLMTVSGEDFLKAEDTNVAVGTAKRYYEFYKVPRKRFKLLCRYLFQLNLANKIYVSSSTPFTIISLPCKIVGIVLDVDNMELDLDCEEII